MLSTLFLAGGNMTQGMILIFTAIYIFGSLPNLSRSGSTKIMSVANDTTVEVNGQRHAITLRSDVPVVRVAAHDVPLLLVLHGGPGASDIPFLHETDYLLEDHFIVVHYDQRSAGKSCRYYDGFRESRNFTIQQHVEDALAIIDYLKKDFHQPKIYLVGGSWGSILCMILAKRQPELFHFVAVHGIVVDGLSSELIGREFILSQFPMADLPVPPYEDRVEDLMLHQRWLAQAGGIFYKDPLEKVTNYVPALSQLSLYAHYAKHILLSPEYSWTDKLRFHYCSTMTTKQMMVEVFQFNAYKDLQGELEVPMLFLHGRHDQLCAIVNSIQAPWKRLIWFEKSGHFCDREEAELFQKILIQTFLGDESSYEAKPDETCSSEGATSGNDKKLKLMHNLSWVEICSLATSGYGSGCTTFHSV